MLVPQSKSANREWCSMRMLLGVSLLIAGWSSPAFAETPALGADPTAEQLEFFEKSVRPLLVEKCQTCHGPNKQQGSLRLDSRASILTGGDSGPAVVPGKVDKSLLIEVIHYGGDTFQMPPKGKLKETEIAALTKWVEQGIPWPKNDVAAVGKVEAFNLAERKSKHWSFQPLTAPAPPAVKQTDWVRTPVDAFILSKLEQAGLKPAAPADKRALLRRVSFDLTGLPPTPAEIDAFLADDTPQAYEKVIDRLLASPRYGERWARHWLDLARYAETAGHEFDFEMPTAYRYRDYVIRAYNDDLPYNQFVIEHLAGDLLPEPRRNPTEQWNESILGTGFFFLGESKHSPVDIREDEAARVDNQLDVLSKTFLGLTVACARCHDHKFDAISTKDYYALAGFLQSSRQQDAYLDSETIRPRAEALSQVKGRARQMAAEAVKGSRRKQAGELGQYLLAARAAIDPRVKLETPASGAAAAQQIKLDAGRLEAMQKMLREAAKSHVHPLFAWALLATDPSFNADTPEGFEKWRRSALAKLKNDDKKEGIFKDFAASGYQGWYTTGEAFQAGPTRGLTVDLAVSSPENPAVNVAKVYPAGVAHSGAVALKERGVLRSETFVIEKPFILYHGAGKDANVRLIIDSFQRIQNPIYGELAFSLKKEVPSWHAQNVRMWVGHKAYIEILDQGDGYAAIDQIRFADAAGSPVSPNEWLVQIVGDAAIKTPAELAARLQAEAVRSLEECSAAGADASTTGLAAWISEQNELFGSIELPNAGEYLKVTSEADRLTKELPVSRLALAMTDGTSEDEQIFIRGSHKNLGEAAQRRFLEAFVGDKPLAPAKGSGRLDLARQMVDPAVNPLVPRVMVNRIWQHHFGRGLSPTPDDFGNMGQAPTHPELLDYLASEFIRGGWTQKRMHKLLVLSNTYQMASRADAAAEAADPVNALWHRMPIQRLEAEAIRDAILAVTGRLDTQMYGPGVKPHLSANMIGRGRPGQSGPVDGDGRRSIYLNVRRNFLIPMLLAFDFPQPFTAIGKRSVSNVPAQALSLMNNPFVVEQSALWGKKIQAQPGATPDKIAGMYVAAFGRPPEPEELTSAVQFLDEQSKRPGGSEVQAWADLGHVMFNVKEFIFIH